MRTLLSFSMLCLASLLSMSVYAHDFEAVNNDGVTIYYKITSEDEKTVAVSFKGNSYSDYRNYKGSVNIPANVVYNSTEYSVTSIDEYAFYSCSQLTSVTIPNTVMNIGDNAFSFCQNVKTVSISNSVVSIGASAFFWCSSLTSITIPNSVVRIGNMAFCCCYGLTSITIGNSVTSIGRKAFSSCSGLTSILVSTENCNYDSRDNCNAIIETATNTLIAGCKNTIIPTSVNSIGESAFNECYGLTSINIPNSVTSIGSAAFRNCSGLTSINITNSVTSIGDYAFSGCSKLPSEDGIIYVGEYLAGVADKTKSSYNIKEGIKWIGEDAFSECSNLLSAAFPNTVTSIGQDAFSDCTSLASLVIPSSVSRIDKYAFYRCPNLTSISVESGNTQYDSRNNCNAIIETSSNTLLCGSSNTLIPNSVQSIGDYAFYNRSGLISIEIPNSVTSIGDFAFCGCSNLTSITIPNSVTSIGEGVFNGCTNLIAEENSMIYAGDILVGVTDKTKTSYIIKEGTKRIGESAFYGCNDMESVVIPNTIQTIGSSAFYECSKLKSVNIPNNVNRIGSWAFYNCSNLKSVTLPNSLTDIESNSFNGCNNLASITIPNSVAVIGESAFQECSSLTSINIPTSVVTISSCSFQGCSGLQSLTIPISVTSIGEDAFKSCSGLSSISVQQGNTIYDSRNNCNAIVETSSNTLLFGCKNTVIPNSVSKIGNNAFRGCSNLSSISIPNSVTIIGIGAFGDCSSLIEVTIPNRVMSIERSVFYNCSNLKSVTIPNSVLSIDNAAFYNCVSLSTVTIPNSVTSIGDYAFYYCESLTAVEIPNSVKHLGAWSFQNCTGLQSVSIGNSVMSIEQWAFLGCSNLKTVNIPKSVSRIVGYAFNRCPNLKDVTVEWTDNIVIPDVLAFRTTDISNATLHVPTGTKALYQAADVWKDFGKIKEEIPEEGIPTDEIWYEASEKLVETQSTSSLDSGLHLGSFNTKISSHTFSDGQGIIKFNGNVTRVGNNAFQECTNLTSVTLPNSVTSIGDGAFSKCSSLSSINIPDGVTSIERAAFEGCKSLLSITIPNTVTSIGAWAFNGCWLTSITIPNSVTSIGNNAFFYCRGLTSISVASGNSKYDSRENCNAIIETSTNKLLYGCQSTIIPNSVTSIENGAFDQTFINSITIPNSVINIGSAFYGCIYLKSVTIPNSVKSIAGGAFGNCSRLRDVTVGWTENIIVPVTINEYGTFSAFKDVNLSYVTLHVPAGTKSLYEATDIWKDFGTIVEYTTDYINFVDANVKAICLDNWDTNGDGELSQEEAADVTSLAGKFKANTTIASFAELSYFTGLTSFGAEEFSGCSSLATITIPSKFTALPTSVFSGCGFTSFTIPNNITTIGESAFSGCTKLASVTLGSGVNSIGNYAFKDCTSLTSFTTNVADPATITLGSDVWKNVNLSNVPLTAPNAESLKKYSTAAQWSAFKYDIPKEVSFDENSDITSQLADLVAEGKRVDFTINRTFYCDGYFNTICLPFSMTAAEIAASPIGGYKELKKFVKAEVKGKKKDEMNVNVGLSATKEIEAGVPYFISWHKGANIVNPTFENVLVTESVGKTISGGGMSCIGILTPTVLDPTVNNLLFLGEANWLYWSNDMTPLKAFRAYFSVNSVSMVNFRKDMPAYFVDMDNVTGIETIVSGESRPVKYLENGKVVIEKNGVKYDTMGRVIK